MRNETDLMLAVIYLKKKQSSDDRNLEFSLTFSEYKKIFSRKTCYYTGKRFVDFNKRSSVNKGDWKTLDRKNSSIGYTVENTVAACGAINTLKAVIENPLNNLTFKQALKALEKIV